MKFDQTPISDLVIKCKTWNPQRDGNGEFDYIDLSSIDKDAKRIFRVERYQCSEAPSRARQIVEAGDVLVATVRPNLNGVALVGEAHHGMTASTGYCVLRPIPERLDSGFLFHWVKTGVFVQRMIDVATGANYPAVSDANVKASTIPLPPLTEQKRIAGILDAADALRVKRRAALAELDTLLQSTFLDMFGDPVTNPMGWEVKELADVVQSGTIVTYGIVQAGDEFPDGVPYIRTGDIVDGEIDTTGLRHTNPSIAAKFERSRVRTGEIVMSIRATVGTTGLVPPELDGANLTQGTARISPGDETQPHFLLHFIRTQGCQSWIQNQIKGATFREITLKRLRQMPVLVPPLNIQCHFTAVVESTERQKTRMRTHLAELESLFASLQSKAFNGEL